MGAAEKTEREANGTVRERFARHVVKPEGPGAETGCWQWRGSRQSQALRAIEATTKEGDDHVTKALGRRGDT